MKQSAGLLLYRQGKKVTEVLLVHPGGPFWKNKDDGAWSIPKGEFTDEEDALAAAVRETEEEIGIAVSGKFIALTPVKNKSGKRIFAWAIRADFDPAQLKSNYFDLEWPPRSGKKISIPEVDRAEWFDLETAKIKLSSGQSDLIDQLADLSL